MVAMGDAAWGSDANLTWCGRGDAEGLLNVALYLGCEVGVLAQVFIHPPHDL